MTKHFRYARYLLRHKWFVFVECCRLGIPWQGITHDLSKFRSSEWMPYAEYFYGKKQEREWFDAYAVTGGVPEFAPWGFYVKDRFNLAWLKHQHRNPHHWQWWLIVPSSFAMCYNHNDGGGTWQTRDNSNPNLKKSAPNAKCLKYVRNFVMVAKSVATVLTVTQTSPRSTETPIANGTRSTTRPTESALDLTKPTLNVPERKVRACGVSSWSIMEVVHRIALAVVKIIKSFWHSITSTDRGDSTASSSPADSAVPILTAGQSGTAILQSSGCSATTAIAPTDSTVTVPTRETQILVNDDGPIHCFSCGADLTPYAHLLLPLPMPDRYRKEMLADWKGAGKANGKPDTKAWYEKQRELGRQNLHPETRKWIEGQL